MTEKRLKEEGIERKTFDVQILKGQTVSICTCGYSQSLPFCDNAHRKINEREGTSYFSLKVTLEDEGRIRVSSRNYK